MGAGVGDNRNLYFVVVFIMGVLVGVFLVTETRAITQHLPDAVVFNNACPRNADGTLHCEGFFPPP